MKNKLAILILFITFLPTFSLADSDFDIKNESLIKELVQKEPDSEKHHYDYAMIFYKQDRMDEAKQQLTQLLALNPNHEDGKSMLKSIEQLQGITDAQQRSKLKEQFAIETMKNVTARTKQFANSIDLSPEGQSKIKQAFIEKYHPCEHEEEQAKLLTPEHKEIGLIKDYENAGKDDEAETMYKAFLVKYPSSSEATILLIKLYLKNNKLNLAAPLITQGHIKFPQSITLEIYAEHLPKLQAAHSLEQKKQAMDDIAGDEEGIGIIRLECYLKKNK